MYQLKSNIIIHVKGKGNLDKKTIQTDSGQNLARFIMTERPDLAHNLQEIDGTGKKVKTPELSIPVELKKKEASASTSKVVKADGNSSQPKEQPSVLSESKPLPENVEESSQPKKSDVSEATKKPSKKQSKKG